MARSMSRKLHIWNRKEGWWFRQDLKRFWVVKFQETTISHLGKRKIVFDSVLGEDMLVPSTVHDLNIHYLHLFTIHLSTVYSDLCTHRILRRLNLCPQCTCIPVASRSWAMSRFPILESYWSAMYLFAVWHLKLNQPTNQRASRSTFQLTLCRQSPGTTGASSATSKEDASIAGWMNASSIEPLSMFATPTSTVCKATGCPPKHLPKNFTLEMIKTTGTMRKLKTAPTSLIPKTGPRSPAADPA